MLTGGVFTVNTKLPTRLFLCMLTFTTLLLTNLTGLNNGGGYVSKVLNNKPDRFKMASDNTKNSIIQIIFLCSTFICNPFLK